MLQDNSDPENEIQSLFPGETQTDDSIGNYDEELPDLPEIMERPLQPQSTFDGGLLVVWGCGEFGQHGHGHSEDVPCVDAVGSPLWLGQERMVIDVACGSSHTLVLTDDNKVYSWGNSNSGQLGVGTTETSPHPHALHLGVSAGAKIRGITCGTRHSFVWTQDGDCFSFGNNYSAQLGYDFRKPDFKENQAQPIFVDTLLHRPVSQVACGARHSVFLFTNGQVAAVGVNNRGQIGCGDTVDVICPKTIPDIPAMSVIACGNSHSIAADAHGSVYVWGYSKACGFKTADVLSPSCVYSCTEHDSIVDMAGGDSHSMILTSSGILHSWGNNFEGQLGHGKSVKFLSKPKELNSSLLPGKVVSISVGENTSAAVTEDGELYLWGKNASQVIRDDESSRFFQFEPYHVPLGVWKALKVSCGSWHVSCVVEAGQKTKTKEIHEEKPEITKNTSDIAVEESTFQSVKIPRHNKREIELNKEGKDVVSNKSSEDLPEFFVSSDDKQEPLRDHRASSDVIFDENHTGIESNQRVFSSEEDNSVKQILERVYTPQNDQNDVEEDCREEKPDESYGFDSKDVNDRGYFDAVVENGLEKEPSATQDDNNEEETKDVIEDMNEEKPAVEEKPAGSSRFDISSGCTKSEELNEDLGNKLGPDIASHDTSSISDAATVDRDISTVSDSLYEVTVKDQTPFECERPAPNTNADCASTKHVDFDYGFVAFNGKTDTTPPACVKEEKPVIKKKEGPRLVTRTRAHSEQRSSSESPLAPQDIANGLRSGSLESLKVYHQQEDVGKGLRPKPLSYSPPANSRSPGGHLRREKRPARMLRNPSYDVEYHLPNQPVHTVDISMTPYHLRPHPPLNRTQSSPSLYSSNLIRSPLGARRKSSASAKVPRPPTSGVNSDESLPPRAPARGVRRNLQLNPVFSSGTSWRKRK